MRKTLHGFLSLLVAAALLAPGLAVDSANIAEVERRAGQVDIRPPALASAPFNEGWQQVSPLAYIEKQGWTRTWQRAIADCRSLSGGVACRIGPRTLISIQDFVDSPDEVNCIIWLPEGSVRTKVPPVPGKQRKYEVRTPNAVLSAQGTEWSSQYAVPGAEVQPDPFDPNFNLGAAPGETRTVILEGTVIVTPLVDGRLQAERSVALQAGQTARVDAAGTVHLGAASGLTYLGDRKVKIDGSAGEVDLSDDALARTAASEIKLQTAPSPLAPEPVGRTIERGTYSDSTAGFGEGNFQAGGVPLQTSGLQPPQSTCAPPGGSCAPPPCMP